MPLALSASATCLSAPSGVEATSRPSTACCAKVATRAADERSTLPPSPFVLAAVVFFAAAVFFKVPPPLSTSASGSSLPLMRPKRVDFLFFFIGFGFM